MSCSQSQPLCMELRRQGTEERRSRGNVSLLNEREQKVMTCRLSQIVRMVRYYKEKLLCTSYNKDSGLGFGDIIFLLENNC